jgi:CSLREA domain-containing protein
VALAAAALLLPAAARAATIPVTTDLDDPAAAPGDCSLRAAMQAANTDSAANGCPAGDPGEDTIVLPAGVYGLNDMLIPSTPIVVRGPGSGSTVITQGTGRPIFVLLDTGHRPALTVDGVTLTGGHAGDGGRGGDFAGSLVAPGSTGSPIFGGGGGNGTGGGAINNFTSGAVTVLNSRLTGNSAGRGGDGGNGLGGRGQEASGAGNCGTGGTGTGGEGGRGGDGGAIWSTGPVTVRDSVLSGNTAGDAGAGGRGGGGDGGNSAASFLAGCDGRTGTGGPGGAGGTGGAIFAQGAAVVVERTVMTGNRAGHGGAGGVGQGGSGGTGGTSGGSGGDGGAGHAGAAGKGGSGGAIGTSGSAPVTLTASTVSGNAAGDGGDADTGTGGPGGDGGGNTGIGWTAGDATGGAGGAGGDGGGILAGGALTVATSLFTGNHAGAAGAGGAGHGGRGGDGKVNNGHGGTGGTATGGQGGQGGRGGAAALAAGGSFAAATLESNTGGVGSRGGGGTGGHGGDAPNNTAGFGGSGVAGSGGDAGAGAIAVVGGAVDVRAVTVDGNAGGAAGAAGTATAGTAGDGSTAGGPGTATPGSAGAPTAGGVDAGGGGVTLTSSILASNTPFNCDGAVTDGGNDIRFGDESCPGITADPKLQPLADNGGPTRTQALGAGSAAIDVVPPGPGCTATDQRGVSRPRGPACDAGAYERAAPDATTGDAGGIGETSATLNGSVAPNAGSATNHFEYGKTSAYGKATPDQTLGGGVAPVGVSAGLTGLAPNTTYHYRLVATNSDGTAAGEDRTFKTARDTTPPRFLSASVRPRRFAVNRHGKREKPVAAAVKHGTTFRLKLSEAARVVFTLQRRSAGRHKRWVKAGRFAMKAKQGANKKAFSGRIGRKALRPGTYRATLVARDAAGNRSKPRRLSLRVVR